MWAALHTVQLIDSGRGMEKKMESRDKHQKSFGLDRVCSELEDDEREASLEMR